MVIYSPTTRNPYNVLQYHVVTVVVSLSRMFPVIHPRDILTCALLPNTALGMCRVHKLQWFTDFLRVRYLFQLFPEIADNLAVTSLDFELFFFFSDITSTLHAYPFSVHHFPLSAQSGSRADGAPRTPKTASVITRISQKKYCT